MTETRFTKGPWRQAINDCTLIMSMQGKLIGDRLAEVYTNRLISHEEMCANSNLIAAAPELYEALQNMLTIAPSLERRTPQMSLIIAKAELASAKARGEQS